ncbi:hypothetical protein SB773_34010, partial [Bacillus sp. SIMBA_074]
VVGSKLGEAELWVDKLEARGHVIRIDLVESQLDKNQPAEVGIVADARAGLDALVEALGAGEAGRDAREARVARVARVAET